MNKTSIAAIAFAFTSAFAGHAMAADQATDAKTGQQVAAAAAPKAAAKPAVETQGKSAADAFAELDKIKKW